LFYLIKNYNSDLDIEKLSENFRSNSIWEGEVNYIVNLQNKIFRCEILKLDYHNNENAIITIFDDVTYKKKMNDKIIKNEKKLRDITDNMLDFMINVDYKGKIQYVSTSLCAMYNVNYKEIRGKYIYDLIYYEDRKEVERFIKNRLSGISKEKQLEYRLKITGNDYIWVESVMNPIINNKGAIEGFVITSRDIDKKKYFQRALVESEKKYKDFFNLVRNYIYIIDVGNDTIVDMNEFMRNDFLIDNREISISEVFGEDASKLHFKYFYKILKGNKNLEFEFTTKNHLGDEIDLEVSLTPIHDKDKITKIVCMAKDITHKKKMKQLQERHEEDRRKLLEAREYDRIKTEFLANISHELRTPINVIFSALQLEELRSKSVYGDSRKYLRLMKQNCYRLLRLINNLIDVTKIEAGYLPIEYVNIDIVNVVENITMSIVDYAENKDIEVIFDTDMEEKVVSIDLDKTERVVMNILSNAIKFTSKKGVINVKLSEEEDFVKVSIRDTGRGIPKEKLATIFERFNQVDKSLTRDHEGSGIGLYLVKSLVEMQGGNITVHSEIGEGSEFIVRFPIGNIDTYEEVAVTSDIGNSYVERISIEFSDIYEIN
ncbi:ATP-binding protein, partial [Clostridium sp.]|uniref:sensor histidine kinase n=1 Tax=Clostridium sp. TaxID=1506 RepID=UPI003464C2E7